MNSQGYTKDNIHKGNTKIVAGGIDVDGLIRIGDQSAGGDGYVLPSVKGTEGQVLTMNADSTSSFQDVGGGTTGRIIKNLFTMIDREASFGATPTNTYLDGFGNLNLGSIDNFPVGATIHLYTKGTWQTSGNGTSNFVFIINDGSPQTITFTTQNIAPIANNNERFFYNDLILQRTDINEYKFKATGLTSTGSSGDPAVSIFWPASTFTPVPDLTTLSLRFAYKTNNNTFYPLTTTLIVDMILDSSLLIDPPPAPTSHLALTDLNAGDSGHSQFALLQGRSGGQVLSGGITPANFLTLKSHTAGTNNIIVKDLNTTFEKDIDMAQRLIQNCSGVINPTATTGIAGTSSSIGESTTNMSMIFQSNQASIQQLANQIIRFEPSVITSSKNIDMNQNQIDNCLVINNQAGQPLNLIGGSNVSAVILDATPTQGVIIGSNVGASTDITGDTSLSLRCNNGSIDLFPSTLMSVIIGGLPRFAVDSTQVNVGNDLIMNNNNINNANTITASNNLTLNAGNNSGIIIENAPNDTIIFQKSTNHNNNVLDNVGTGVITNILNTGSANITIPVVIGTPSGALQVQNGGAYIKQDLQVDGNIYCDSINNIRPSGGLYSESSGFNIPSTNLTETNLLGQGGSAGTLVIPANTFTQFDSYSFKASGVLSGGSNDTATLRLKSLVNGTTPVELGSIVIQLTDNGLVDVAWKVEADFNVRTLGGAGVGVLVLCGNFAYTNNNDVVKTYLRTIVNNSVFDTTQSNELQFTYQNDGTNPLTNIRIDQASFTKWY